MDARAKRRMQLILVTLLFAAPLLLALILRWEEWRPQRTRNYGELINPPVDITAGELTLSDGNNLNLRDANWRWTLLAFSGPSCEEHCLTALDQVRRARISLNQNADRLRIGYLGAALPGDVLKEFTSLLVAHDPNRYFVNWRPQQADTLAVALIDPNGQAVLRYPAGFDANGLRKDVARLIH